MRAYLAKLRFAADHRWAPDQMSAFLEGEMGPRRRARIQRHVSDCRQCRNLLAGLRLLIGALHRLPAPADGDASRIAAAVRLRISEPA